MDNLPSMLSQLLDGFLIASVVMLVLWIVQLKTQDGGLVDLGWTIILGALAIFFAYEGEGDLGRRILVATMVNVWAIRLAAHILFNRIIGKSEDSRYQALRAHWGKKANFYHFFFFQAQAVLDVMFASIFLIIMQDPDPIFQLRDYIAVAILLVSVVGETVADRQLAVFRADPSNRGKTCRYGLWKYSRHPNYFFEWIHWWAYVAIGIHLPFGGLILLAPILMLFTLLFVTGIPFNEKQALKSRGDDYREYQRTTSSFIPWLPKQ